MSGGNPFEKVTKGQRIKIAAAAWNPLMDVARREAGRAGMGGADPLQYAGNRSIVRVYNGSGSDVDRFCVLGIDDAQITPTDNPTDFLNFPVISGVTPTAAAHTGWFAITIEPIISGKIGTAVLSGMVPVRVNMIAATDAWADVKDGDATQLQSNALGSAQILYVESGTGTKWAWVRLGTNPDARPIRVKLTGASQIGTDWRYTYTGTRQARLTAGAEEDDPNYPDPITLYNDMEAYNGATGAMGNGDTITSGQTLQPVGGAGCAGSPVVHAWPDIDCNSALVYTFSTPNPPTC
jgi:hypothetical protein